MTPISLAPPGSAIYDALRQYKWLHRPATAHRRQEQLAALLDAFVARHHRCLAPQGWDLVAVVPSLRHRAAPQPLAEVVASTRHLGAAMIGLRAGSGMSQLGRALGVADAFRVEAADQSRARGRRVLVVDDLLTTGAHLQSACAAARATGATVVGALVIGRRMAPGWSDDSVLAWTSRPGHAWSLDRCARCPGRRAERALAGTEKRGAGPPGGWGWRGASTTRTAIGFRRRDPRHPGTGSWP